MSTACGLRDSDLANQSERWGHVTCSQPITAHLASTASVMVPSSIRTPPIPAANATPTCVDIVDTEDTVDIVDI